jgi:hypothetical protein
MGKSPFVRIILLLLVNLTVPHLDLILCFAMFRAGGMAVYLVFVSVTQRLLSLYYYWHTDSATHACQQAGSSVLNLHPSYFVLCPFG